MTTIINGSSPSITFSDNTTQTTAFTTTPTINTITSAASTALTLQSAGTTAVTIDTSQNVGIGTASPSYKLDVQNNASAITIRIKNSNSTSKGGIQFDNYVSTGSGSVYYDNTNGVFTLGGDAGVPTVFNAAGTERMRIDTSGNLSVGRTASLARITAETTTDECIFAINSAGASSATMASWNNASTGNNYLHAFFVDAGGSNVGNIDYLRSAGLVRYNTTSDATLKNIIGDSNGQRSLEILNTTRIREFAWKNDTEQKPQIGVIAQELYETYKGAVSVGGENDKGEYRPWGVDKTAFTFHLIAGWQAHEKLIQEQQEVITTLTARITALENK